ncbi:MULTISPECIES: hypothetical protein [unclassified Bacillus (in: firmicutes)]|nr:MULTISPECIES: hypothetical protein [unclassified Bacillus (in: firmicutes)]
MTSARTAINNVNNVNTVQVNIDPNMLKNMQPEAAATAEPKVEEKKNL